jgi:hypothetical protein
VTNGKPPEPPGRDQLTPTTPFGSGLFDSFETDGHGGATGDMVYGRWLEFSRDDSEIAGTDIVSQSEDGQIQPADGQFMMHVDNRGTLYREVSFYGAKNPHLTFAWATTGLDGEDVFKVMVGGQTVLERGSSTPPNTWQQESVDLSRFVVRDETLRISFSCRAEPGTSIYLDDLALTEAP